jgi:uncharacterized protein (DUF2141 family)
MRFRSVFFVFVLAAILVEEPASAARVIVTINGLHSAQGVVFIGLYASPGKFLKGSQTDAVRRVAAQTEPITVVFDNLPPGTYAVGAYHDENANDHLDTDLLGLPIEGYALSNGVHAVLAEPNFQEAAFTVGAEDRPVALHITCRRQAGRASHHILTRRARF